MSGKRPSNWLDVALAALAAYRATYMILGEDGPFDLVRKLRERIYSNYKADHWIYRGFDCPYCISFWAALFFVLAPSPVRKWFAAAEIARRLIEHDSASS
jgi:hypothetical protein